MHWLLIGYMFLFIDRPFEVWPILGEFRLERIYMFGTFAVWLIYPRKRWLPNLQHAAYAALALSIIACWVISPWMERSQPIIEDWLKIVVFYLLLVSSVNTEKALKTVAVGFVVVMGLYLTHSFREYLGGRHTFRMGIARMIGVDSTLGDPNSFGASIVFLLPFIPAVWKAGIGGRFGKLALTGLLGLCVVCILLTGSRSSLLGLTLWAVLTMLRARRGCLWIVLVLAMAPIGFFALPASLQTRFETIIDSDVGPENAKQSGEGRIEGFLRGLDLWMANPLTGVGPGAWRPATKSGIESHNLYGQLLGETGSLGAVSFFAVLGCFWANWRSVRKTVRRHPELASDFCVHLTSAVATGVILLLFMGNFGHNLFRFTWLWYGGFLVIAAHCLRRKAALMAEETDEEELEEEIVELTTGTTFPVRPQVGPAVQ